MKTKLLEMKKRIINPLFSSIIVPFAIVMLTLSILVFGEYYYIFDATRDAAVSMHNVTLSSVAHQLENELLSYNTVVSSVNESLYLSQQLRSKETTGSNYYVHTFVNSLPGMENSILADDYYIYVEKTGHLYAPKRGFLSPELYYGSIIGAENKNFDQWKDEVLNCRQYGCLHSMEVVYMDDSREAVLRYCLPYMPVANSLPVGRFIFYIQLDRLHQLVTASMDASMSMIYLTDPSGQILACLDENGVVPPSENTLPSVLFDGTSSVHITSGNTLYGKVTLSEGSCSLVVATPASVFHQRAFTALIFPLVSILLTLLLVLIFAAGYLRKIHYPLSHMSELLNLMPRTGSRSFIMLDEELVRIIDENQHLAQNLSLQHRARLEDITTDPQSRNQKMYNLIDEAPPIPDMPVCFVGVYARAGNNDPADAELQPLLEQELKLFSNLKYLSTRSEHTYAILYFSQEFRAEVFRETLEQLHHTMRVKHGVTLRLYVGFTSSLLERVCYSFAKAWELLIADPLTEDAIVIQDAATAERYLLTSSDENALTALFQSGDRRGLAALLTDIFNKNFSESVRLPQYMKLLLYARLFDLLTQCSLNSGVKNSDLERVLHMPPEQAHDWFQERFASGIQDSCLQNEKSTNELHEQLITYIRQNFRDPEIRLSSIASVFGMTESYLSILVKKILGQNYSSYLESLRIDYANELLRDGSYNVADIATMAGYDHVTSFRRAYKRIMGCAPSDYQKRQQDSPQS